MAEVGLEMQEHCHLMTAFLPLFSEVLLLHRVELMLCLGIVYAEQSPLISPELQKLVDQQPCEASTLALFLYI